MVEMAVNAFAEIVEIALPISIVFNFGGIIVSTFMRVAFGGRLWFGK